MRVLLAGKLLAWMSCPFAGMTRIRFKGSPRYAAGLSAPYRSSPRNAVNVGPRRRVSTHRRCSDSPSRFAVIAGLDPAIHPLRKNCLGVFTKKMDHPNSGLPEFGHFRCASRINPTCMVKPAGDERGGLFYPPQ